MRKTNYSIRNFLIPKSIVPASNICPHPRIQIFKSLDTVELIGTELAHQARAADARGIS